MFIVDLTRQFEINDHDGEHDHFIQIHCELRYRPDQALERLGSFNRWFFHDTDDALDPLGPGVWICFQDAGRTRSAWSKSPCSDIIRCTPTANRFYRMGNRSST
jgi:hypothetical protein